MKLPEDEPFECWQGLGYRIRKRRLELRLSQVQVAKRIASRSYRRRLGDIERGRTPNLYLATLVRLSDALGMSIHEMVTGKPWVPPKRRPE